MSELDSFEGSSTEGVIVESFCRIGIKSYNSLIFAFGTYSSSKEVNDMSYIEILPTTG